MNKASKARAKEVATDWINQLMATGAGSYYLSKGNDPLKILDGMTGEQLQFLGRAICSAHAKGHDDNRAWHKRWKEERRARSNAQLKVINGGAA